MRELNETIALAVRVGSVSMFLECIRMLNIAGESSAASLLLSEFSRLSKSVASKSTDEELP